MNINTRACIGATLTNIEQHTSFRGALACFTGSRGDFLEILSDRFSNLASITDLRRWHLYTRVLPFDPLSFARLSRSRPPIFPRLTGMTDYTMSVCPIDLYCDCRGLYYARRHYARNITAAGIHCGPIIGRAARILIKIYCVVKIVRIMHSVEVQELFFTMLNFQLTKFSFREFEKFSFRDI